MEYPISTVIDKTAADIDAQVRALAKERSLNDDVLEYAVSKVLNDIRNRKIAALSEGYISMVNAVDDAQARIKEVEAKITQLTGEGGKADEQSVHQTVLEK